jgi:hypothetical protein
MNKCPHSYTNIHEAHSPLWDNVVIKPPKCWLVCTFLSQKWHTMTQCLQQIVMLCHMKTKIGRRLFWFSVHQVESRTMSKRSNSQLTAWNVKSHAKEAQHAKPFRKIVSGKNATQQAQNSCNTRWRSVRMVQLWTWRTNGRYVQVLRDLWSRKWFFPPRCRGSGYHDKLVHLGHFGLPINASFAGNGSLNASKRVTRRSAHGYGVNTMTHVEEWNLRAAHYAQVSSGSTITQRSRCSQRNTSKSLSDVAGLKNWFRFPGRESHQ